jgi:D-arabinose 5-phosphate isomerase GutQ
MNIVRAIQCAEEAESEIIAIVGRDGGYAGAHADIRILIPCDTAQWVTPVTEGVQSVVLHALACHPLLQVWKAKWEGLQT